MKIHRGTAHPLRGRNATILMLTAIVLSLTSIYGCRIKKNFYTVHKKTLYRSAQLRRLEFKRAIRRKKLKTILNLRGENTGKSWYDAEVKVADEMGVTLIDIGLSARRIPHRHEMIALLEALDTMEYPALVHCRAGADRSGLAAAIYKIEKMEASLTTALKQLTPKYLHIEAITPAQRWFMKNVYGPKGKQWILDHYDPCEGDYKHYDVEKYCSNGGQNEAFTEEDDT